MPKDQRLYMTFPIDFWMHPKIAPLSDAAFRAFVEINGFSRMQDLDGRVPVVMARKLWKPRAIAQLLANHPERPSLSLDGDDYVIWNYDEHQMTRADREALSAKNAENGRKGGRPPKAKPTETQSVSDGNPHETQLKAESESESESRSELKTDVTIDTESSHLSIARAEDSDSEIWGVKAKLVGISDLPNVIRLLAEATGQTISARGAVDLAQAILSKSAKHVRNVDAYVATVCRESAAEVQQAYFDLDIEAVAS